ASLAPSGYDRISMATLSKFSHKRVVLKQYWWQSFSVAVSELNLGSAVGFSKWSTWKMVTLKRGLAVQSKVRDCSVTRADLPTAFQPKFGER
ncbi:hypothetical protein, partial [Levilactobacillus hammesii]